MATKEVTLSSKHQIVLPREAREALGLRPGQKLLVVTLGDRVIVLRKVTRPLGALGGLMKGKYPRRYLQDERASW